MFAQFTFNIITVFCIAVMDPLTHPTHRLVTPQPIGLPFDSSNCPIPPENFDPTSAIDATIALYGLPKRPTQEPYRSEWIKIVQHAKVRSCVDGVPTGHYAETSSDHWSGYFATPWPFGSFSQARGFFSPSRCDFSGSNIKAVAWVGLGGGPYHEYTNLWQGGVEIDASSYPYYAPGFWYEAYPTTQILAIPSSSMPYSCGDQVYAYVDYNVSYSNLSYIYLANIAQNRYYTKVVVFTPNQSTAEWIDERPGCGNGPTKLANFGNDTWSGVATGTGGGFSNISNSGSLINMVDNDGTGIVITSGLSSSGGFSGFQDTWLATGHTSC